MGRKDPATGNPFICKLNGRETPKGLHSNEKLRTCPVSGEVMEADPRFTEKD